MALYEVVLQQQFNAGLSINRWNYEMAGSPVGVTGSFALSVAFGTVRSGSPETFVPDSVMDRIAKAQTADNIFVQVACLNVYDNDDFFTISFPGTVVGEVAGLSLSPVNALGFRTNRVTRAVRRGTKRFWAVPTSYSGEFGIITAAGITAGGLLADAMSEELAYTEGGNSLTFKPTIVSKQKYVTPAGNDAYRYYSTLALQLDHIAQGFTWEMYPQLRAQQSRQVGRGM